ncbi:MAG: hypothetical protein J3K34DRAFT_407674 [Monoraphidium minutum]|nr:MAG: hypothetical protein J3K34DRAFT_407674 [Monoraphidium minutum]
MASPSGVIKGLVREFLGTPSRATNFASATYALLGAAFAATGAAYMLAPSATLAGVFGAGAARAAGPAAGLMWQMLGAGVACVVAGACYSLKEGASFRDLTETKFKWLNFALAAGALGHVIMLGPLAAGQGGPLAPVLLAVWGLTMLMGATNAFA